MGGLTEPRGAVDVEADQAAARSFGLAGVKTDPHPHALWRPGLVAMRVDLEGCAAAGTAAAKRPKSSSPRESISCPPPARSLALQFACRGQDGG